MASLNRPVRLNRGLLAVLGVVLVAAGAFAYATHARWLTVLEPAAPLVPGTALPPTWVLYVAAAVAVVLGLLSLRWLLAQLARRPKTQTWRYETDPARGRTELPADAAVVPFTEEVRAGEGVHAVRATLAGARSAPTLALVVTVDQDGDPRRIRERLTGEHLPRLRQALDLDDLPVTIEFRFSTSRAARIH
ncbi:alkaline shock response membrane anchor protein AmaP [Amycolatopsis jiangsuensis]|uniref:Membrane protein implicated in regulation of membrane protease activity n=1 Tax=Amycolatopsis jiangsuensis TaxID=1181879 RepID=A0A840IT60_9PSEU|nr:alkaline shock response membrane anchor protein AmaP [Amycolatopsis jiangsuensis]MBB4684164.1 membrane protein implicated in regulation of membrane protease activity [Amycolatopsis jiangsuensis]